MTGGQRVAQVQLGYAGRGIVENPWASNHDHGGPIDRAEQHWGMSGEPYCAMGADQGYRDAGVSDSGVMSPSTAVMCDRAQSKGLWLPSGRQVPPGALIILCDIHVETAINQRANGWIDCVGWNVNQGVRKTVRTLGGGWRCIVVPDLASGQVETVVMYGFDDLTLKPARKGPWHTLHQREATIRDLLAHNRHLLIRRVRVPGDNQFAFDILAPDQRQWHFGPWDKPGRQDELHGYQAAHPHHRLRPWSIPITHEVGGAAPTRGETVT